VSLSQQCQSTDVNQGPSLNVLILCLLWSPYVIGQTIIFLPCGFFLSFFFFPRLISAIADWISTGHPCKFQRVSRLGSVTARHLVVSVSQTAALNRGRHLCSAGRPSCWALAHILVDVGLLACCAATCMMAVQHQYCVYTCSALCVHDRLSEGS